MADGDNLSAALTEIRGREQAATPGPWGWRGNIDNGDPYLTSLGYRDATGPDGTVVRHHAGDVLGHVSVDLTRADAILRGVGDPDSLPEPKVSPDPAGTYEKRYDAAVEAARETEIGNYLTDDYGEPRTERRLAFCTGWFYTDARKLVTFQVAPDATDRSDPRVYRADITGIRHPDAEFIAHAREDVTRLLAALDEVLKLHRPRQLYGMMESFSGGHLCAHGPDYDGDAHFEGDDGVWYCRDHPTVMVCDSCADPAYGDLYAEWPCATYAAITRALTGEASRG